MAKMFPQFGPKKNDSPEAEPDFYDLLKTGLDDDFYIIHSIPWLSSFVKEFKGNRSPIGEVDFIILHPSLGCLAIEVKGGYIKHGRNGFYYGKSSYVDPVNQLKRGIFALQKMLNEKGITIRFGQAYYFPKADCPTSKLPPELFDNTRVPPVNLVIDIKDKENVAHKVTSLMSYFKTQIFSPDLSEYQIQSIIELILPTADYSPCWLARIDDDYRVWLKLSEEQIECTKLAVSNNRTLVTGWPGTGKTIVLVQAARQLAAIGKKCLIVTFNNLLSKKIKGELEDEKNCDVTTFHQLCRRFTSEDIGEFEYQDWANTQSYEFLDVAIKKGALANYDALIVDEGQVIKESGWMSLVEAFSDKKIIVMCDPTQAFDFEEPVSQEYLADLLGIEVFLLTKSLRMPKKVCERLKLFNSPNYSVINPRYQENDTLIELITDNQHRALREVVSKLQSQSIDLSQICVLKPSSLPIPASLVPQGVYIENIGKFRGLEKPIIIVYVSSGISNIELFCAYSRATTRCIVIMDAHEVRENNYDSLSDDVYKNKQSQVDQAAEKALTSSIIENLGLSEVQIAQGVINLTWCDNWNAYVLRSDAGILISELLASYFSNETDARIVSWSILSKGTIRDIKLEQSDLHAYSYRKEDNRDLKYCHECNNTTPHKRHTAETVIDCMYCGGEDRIRDLEFEMKVSELNDFYKDHHSFDENYKKNLHPILFTIGALNKRPILASNLYLTKATMNATRIFGHSVIPLMVIYMFINKENNKEYTIKDVAKEVKKWSIQYNDIPASQWNGYINDCFTKIEDAGIVTNVGKGIRKLDVEKLITDYSPAF